MKLSKLVTTIDTHTGGNPTRTVTAGAPKLYGATMIDKMAYMSKHHDDFRRFLLFEPRGHGVMSGCVLTEACDPTADVGVVFIETGGYLPMCGHDTIGLCTALIESGMFPQDRRTLRLDTPAGVVEAALETEEGKVKRVAFLNVPSFLYRRGVRVEVPEVGEVTLDIAYGGNFYGIVDARTLGLELRPERSAGIIQCGVRIREAVNACVEVVHPELAAIRGMTHVEFYSDPAAAQAHCRNAVVIPPGGIDRSPCGTGTAAKVAALCAKGELRMHEQFVHESIIGSLFRAKAVEETQVGGLPAVIAQISGSAWVTGLHQFVIDPDDPLKDGFLLQ